MKFLLLLACLTLVADAGPNYPDAAAQLNKLTLLVRITISQIIETAYKDNIQVGESVSKNLASAAEKSGLIFTEFFQKLGTENLSVQEAQGYFKKLKQLVNETLAIVQPELEKLSAASQYTITTIAVNAYLSAMSIEAEIYKLLGP